MRSLPERPLNFCRRLRFALFPARCPLCGSVISVHRLFCQACERHLFSGASLRRFEIPMEDKISVLTVVSVFDYDVSVRQMIEVYKFHGKIDARDALGAAMGLLAEERFNTPFDLVVWVPSSPKRVRELGFDHAGELAYCTARTMSLPCYKALTRIKETRVQHILSREERLINLRGVFRAEKNLTGKRILLVDDIVTTGTSLCECTRELYRAGALQVDAVCIASRQLQ